MVVFVDTSAFFPLLDRDDQLHEKAARFWIESLEKDTIFVTSNYTIIETISLMQHRLGLRAVKSFVEDILPVVNIKWVDESIHTLSLNSMIFANKRNLSLVDCVSFEVMRRFGIETAFTFDRHFRKQGFNCLPEIRKKRV